MTIYIFDFPDLPLDDNTDFLYLPLDDIDRFFYFSDRGLDDPAPPLPLSLAGAHLAGPQVFQVPINLVLPQVFQVPLNLVFHGFDKISQDDDLGQ